MSQEAADTTAADSVQKRVASVLERIRPAVQSDGGDLELVDVTDDGIVQIRLHGECVGCPSSSMTLHMGIERNLRERVPEVTAVQQVS
jgi:Fe-S cluster biogenesis protein NfuA